MDDDVLGEGWGEPTSVSYMGDVNPRKDEANMGMRMEDKTGGPAFPYQDPSYDGNWNKDRYVNGMSLLDYFAGQALMGLLANNEEIPPFKTREEVTEYFARSSYQFARAMIAERSKDERS